jgi:hypothetical protein
MARSKSKSPKPHFSLEIFVPAHSDSAGAGQGAQRVTGGAGVHLRLSRTPGDHMGRERQLRHPGAGVVG